MYRSALVYISLHPIHKVEYTLFVKVHPFLKWVVDRVNNQAILSCRCREREGAITYPPTIPSAMVLLKWECHLDVSGGISVISAVFGEIGVPVGPVLVVDGKAISKAPTRGDWALGTLS